MADQEVKKNRPEENKKSAHVGRKAAGTAALLALLAGGGYFGFGVGNPDGGWFVDPATTAVTAEAPSQATEAPTEIPVTQEPTEATTAPEETTTEDASVLMIRVKENGIEYQGRPVTLAELEQALLTDYQEGKTVRLVDDHAIKAAYDEVQALLDQLKLPVETESD